ncbi:hypothetical protein LTR10_008043 [Elasticomyces elasticus]|uniref:CBM1 domain-containing protein n=1 Tax=Elasticomyces elasticus TaxID=574655 RepID=A0AAN7ZUU3_9PEZI|nr:hypothetical protein LTR10_008043 [Elasticomyces elasticus]KAK4971041.1 hypothetical protein LTR42_008020 [Elasticomyces elasticus]KAK5689745.1 hypothetical protein LTR97_012744 [Elasticomyces elasticus]KAK5721079.1 hypothetical protein LTR15_007043 [Elasticomyces elasticus]
MLTNTLVLLASAASSALAAQAAYAQCGGTGFTGGTTCVSGYTCVVSNSYYSQCLPATGAQTSAKPATTVAPAKTSATTKAVATSTKAASSGGSGSGTIYKASFTEYGAGDSFGSGNCQVKSTACGYYTTGYNAAVSQNEFGVGPGAGAGPACGTCWKLTIQTDSSGKTVSNAGNSIVVEVTNLCPASGNPLCAQNGLGGTNQYGANLNFDTCKDSGASAALFGNSGVGLGVGTAQQVACNSQVGTVVG